MSEKVIQFGRLMVDNFMLWKLSLLKSAIHSGVAMLIAFTGMSVVMTQAEWDQMWWMKKWQFWATIIAVGLKDIIAFIDQTTTTLRRQLGQETEIFKRDV